MATNTPNLTNVRCLLLKTDDGEVLGATAEKNETKIKGLEEDVQNLELSLNKAESEKKTKDKQIATLNDEMARQDEHVRY